MVAEVMCAPDVSVHRALVYVHSVFPVTVNLI